MIDNKQKAKYILEEYANCYSQVDLEELAKYLDKIKAEAYKEVFEKLKDKSIVCKVKLYGKGKFFPCLSAVTLHDINRLKKELVGEDNAEEKE